MISLLELFGGIGAAKKALIKIGVKHKSIDYVEIDEKAVRTHNALFEKKHVPQSVIGYTLKPDILVHGSPCQDFSRAGKRLGGKDEDKTRSSLMWETIKIIRNFCEWKPQVVIWENVKGVLDKDMIKSFNKYLEEMEKLGYTNSFDVLNAMEFGIPQKRERVFVVSILGNNKFNFANLEKKPLKNISEFLEKNVSEKYLINSPSMRSKIKSLGLPNKNKNYVRYLDIIDSHCWTITEKQNRCPNSGIIKINDDDYRLLTELECWRLMGFEDEDYYKALNVHPSKKGCFNSTLNKQAGNSIVVDVLEAIYLELQAMGELKFSEDE